jgi:hypothetical protein
MITSSKITEIFCSIDDFCKDFLPEWNRRLLAGGKSRIKPARLCPSEVMTIQVLFHLSGIRTFKKFYTDYVCKQLRDLFPGLVSYNRFTELGGQMIVPLAIYLKHRATGACTGISFIDSTPLRVCHNRRIHSHKVFDGLAARGQCSIGWFYGFKLHLITSDSGHVVDFMLTAGNTDDRKPLQMKGFIDKLFGKLYGDKGYISKDLFEGLFDQGIHLVTKLRKNMKTKLVTPITDAIMLRKRAICETIIDQLKNIFQIEHSRHRSPKNFLTNLFSALIAYNFTEKKPSLKTTFVDTKQLMLF